MKMLKIMALALICYGSSAMAYWYNDTELNSLQRSQLIDRILKHLDDQITPLEKQLKQSAMSQEINKKLVDLRQQIADERNAVNKRSLYMAEESQRTTYINGLEKRKTKLETLLQR